MAANSARVWESETVIHMLVDVHRRDANSAVIVASSEKGQTTY